MSDEKNPTKSSDLSVENSPLTLPPRFRSASAIKNTLPSATGNTIAEAEAEAGGGRAEGGLGEGEKEVWLHRFVSTLVDKWGKPEEREAYLAFCRKYPPSVLEEALTRVLDTPRERIRKSQGALFVFLVKKLNEER